MKVAVFHNLPSGGAKRALFWVSRELSRDHHITAFVPDTADEAFCPLEDVVSEVRRFSTIDSAYLSARVAAKYLVSPLIYLSPRLRRLGGVERTQAEIARMISAGGYDVVLSEQDRYVYSPFLLRHLTVPTVYYCQQPYRGGREEVVDRVVASSWRRRRWGSIRLAWIRLANAAVGRIDAANARMSRYTVTNSYFTREFILRTYGTEARVSYLGVDTELFRPLGLARGDYVVGVGSMGVGKGYDLAVRAIGRMPSSCRPRFIIVANTVKESERSRISSDALRLGVKLQIELLASDKDLRMLYSRALALLYTPHLEPFGLAPLEAMACGTPVVAVREGGVRETVIDRETGFLTERSEEALSAALELVVSDSTKREELGQTGTALVHSRWTARHAADRLVSHLQRSMGGSP